MTDTCSQCLIEPGRSRGPRSRCRKSLQRKARYALCYVRAGECEYESLQQLLAIRAVGEKLNELYRILISASAQALSAQRSTVILQGHCREMVVVH